MAVVNVARPKGRRGRLKKAERVSGDGAVSVSVDHPAKGEKVMGGHYTFRVGTVGEVGRVEICINQGSWEPCRRSAGYWWYDWSGDKGGWHRAVARAHAGNGKAIESEVRKFRVSAGTTRKPTRDGK